MLGAINKSLAPYEIRFLAGRNCEALHKSGLTYIYIYMPIRYNPRRTLYQKPET